MQLFDFWDRVLRVLRACFQNGVGRGQPAPRGGRDRLIPLFAWALRRRLAPPQDLTAPNHRCERDGDCDGCGLAFVTVRNGPCLIQITRQGLTCLRRGLRALVAAAPFGIFHVCALQLPFCRQTLSSGSRTAILHGCLISLSKDWCSTTAAQDQRRVPVVFAFG